MNKKYFKKIFFTSLISVLIWLIGEVLLIFCMKNEAIWVSRTWLILCFIGCLGVSCYLCTEQERNEKKEKRKQENDNYKNIC